jgi:Fibronectin type III domain
MKAGKGGEKVGVAAPAGKVARPKVAEVPTVAELAEKSGEQVSAAKAKAPQSPAPANKGEAATAMGKVSGRTAAALSYLSVFGAPTPENELSKKYGKLKRVDLIGVGTDFLELAWERPHPDSPPQSYRVETSQQAYEPRTKMFFRQWLLIQSVKPLVLGDGKEGVRVEGLRPSAQYELRVMAVDEQGKISEPSDIYLMRTLAPWKIPTWWWYAGAALLLGVLLLQARKLYLKRMGLSLA